MGSILSISRALPPYRYQQSELAESATNWLAQDPAAKELYKRFCRSSTVEQRYFALPLEEILSLSGNQQREQIYIKQAQLLAEKALKNALALASIDKSQLTTLISTSCTGAVIPAIDTYLINNLKLPACINRIPVYQQGCAGGAFGLGLANRLANNHELTALLSVELCSLIFQQGDSQAGNLVGSAIFADGAACAIISPKQSGYVIRASRSLLIPDSTHLMGYDTWDNGTHLRLDRELPQILVKHLPDQISAFLSEYQVDLGQIKHWLFHPGGAKILDLLESSFQLPSASAKFSRAVLKNYGNISSASILFVISDFMESKMAEPNEFSLVVGIGPGLTAEMILLQFIA